MPFQPSAFQRVLEPLNRHVLDRIVADHNGNRGVGNGANAWTCQRHLKALLFSQFAGLKSLREIEQALSARPAALYHLGLRPAKRSTLSDASAVRPVEIFRDIAQHLMADVTGKLRRQGDAVVELLDASPIPLRDARFTWPEADSRVRGLKLYVHYDPAIDAPTCFDLTSPRTSDTALAQSVRVAAGATYVFDKGFTDYTFWHRITAAGAVFVTRLKKNAHRRDLQATETSAESPILAENLVKIGHKKPRGGATNPLYDTRLREIVVERKDKEPLHLVTNDLTRPASEIAELYKTRWQIELFFKWIKQNLKVKRFWGRSENAVKIQIYVAVIAFLLLRLLKQRHAKSHKGSAKDLLARLSVALFSPLDLSGRAKPPPIPPNLRPPRDQMELVFQ